MKKQILIIMVIIISLVLIITGITLNAKETPKEKPSQDDYTTEIINSVTVCLNPECMPELIDNYAKIKHAYDSEVLQTAIKKLNKTTEDYYKEVISTNMDDASCDALRGKNKYSLRVLSNYNSYTTDKVITLSVQRTKVNICTNETNPILSETYVYDIENDKILTIAETKKLLGITDELIYNSINETNTKLSKIEKVTITTPRTFPDDEIAIYYGTEGTLYVEYYVHELEYYFQAPLEIA